MFETGNAVASALHGKTPWVKVGTTAAADAAEVGGGFIGLGAGDVAREAVVGASRVLLGKKDAPADALSVQLAQDAYSAVSGIGDSSGSLAAARAMIQHHADSPVVELNAPALTGKRLAER